MAVHSTSEPSAVVDVGVFWDYENVRVPKDVKASAVSSKVREALAQHGQIKERNLYFDSRKSTERATDRVNLDLTGWHLVDCPTRNKKETLDKKLIVDVMHFAYDRTSRGIPCCVALITCDGDYAYTLAKIRDYGVKTIVIYGEATTTAGVLLDTCEIAISWVHDVVGTIKDDDNAAGSSSTSTKEAASTTLHAAQRAGKNEEEDAHLARSIGEEVSGRHLTLLHSIDEAPTSQDGWTLDASVATNFHRKRGGCEPDVYKSVRLSAMRGNFVEFGRRELATNLVKALDPKCEIAGRYSKHCYLRLTRSGFAQLDDTETAAGMVVEVSSVNLPAPPHQVDQKRQRLCLSLQPRVVL